MRPVPQIRYYRNQADSASGPFFLTSVETFMRRNKELQSFSKLRKHTRSIARKSCRLIRRAGDAFLTRDRISESVQPERAMFTGNFA